MAGQEQRASRRDAKRAEAKERRKQTIAKLSPKLAAITGLPVEEVLDRGLFGPGEPQAVPIQALGGAGITVRPGTSDIVVLLDTFIGLYHLPPPGVEPRVILDLGSNIGTTIAHFAHLYEDARVCGVELDAQNAELCARNIAPWADRCQVLHAAVAGSDGTSSYDPRAVKLGFTLGSGSESVRTLSTDSVLDHYELDEVDYLKMDIEGAELDVLRQGGRWTERVRSLKVEVHPPGTVDEVFAELTKLGFGCERDDRHRSCVIGRAQAS